MWMRAMLMVGFAFPLALASAQDDQKDGVVREIDIQGLVQGGRGKVAMPTVIATEADLEKIFKDGAAGIAKKVNFKKEELLFFSWSGSGQDKLAYTVDKGEKGPLVLFHYQPGLTRDLRMHARLFALPQAATWKVATRRGD